MGCFFLDNNISHLSVFVIAEAYQK